MPTTLDALAGAAFLVPAVVGWRRSRRPAIWAAVAAVSWFVTGPAGFVHRPLMLHAALGRSSARALDRFSRTVLACSWLLALAQPFVRIDGLAVAIAGLMAVRAWTLRDSGATSAQTVALLAGALALPALARLLRPTDFSVSNGRIVYAVLVALAGLVLALGWARTLDSETDAAIELTEDAPEQTLATLRAQLGGKQTLLGRRAVETAVALLQANVDLRQELARQGCEVRASRERLVGATLEERRRLEGLLAEGALHQLEHLRELLEKLHAGATDPALRSLTKTGLEEVLRTREDVQQLARGLHPAVLTEHGLGAALGELVTHSPLPVRVTAPEGRFDAAAEAAVWYACAEALTNAVKHSGATSVVVDVTVEDGSLLARVTDDGRGGAQPSPGGGLSGLVDRLAVVNGRLSVHSAAGDGTQVTISVPAR